MNDHVWAPHGPVAEICLKCMTLKMPTEGKNNKGWAWQRLQDFKPKIAVEVPWRCHR